MTTKQIDNETTYLSLLNEAIAIAQEKLTTFAFKEGVLADFTTAFGSMFDRETTLALVNEWQNSEFDSFPEIKIVSAATINNANGAYSVDTNKIYIAAEYLLNSDVNAIAALILEEYGHYVDAEINTVDAAGDEGDIFARLVKGDAIDPDLLQQLKAENDKAVVTIDGEKVAIEQNTIRGGNNGDELIGSNYNDLIYGYRGNDTVYGNDGDDTLYGHEENDWLSGYFGNDDIYGGSGDDTLYGNSGYDYFDGGSGIDTAEYISATSGIRVNLNSTARFGIAANQATVDGYGSQDTLYRIEAVDGSNHNDFIVGNDYTNDSLFGENGNDTLHGGGGDDDVSGWHGNDWLYGEGGDDTLWGNTGYDHFDGGNGIDIAKYNSATSGIRLNLNSTARFGIAANQATVDGYGGRDTLYNIEAIDGSDYNDLIIGNDYTKEYLVGNDGDDTIYGGGGDDTVSGRQGNDWLYGEGGDDTLWGKTGNDYFDGGSGVDTVKYTSATSGIKVNLNSTARFGIDANQATVDGYLQPSNLTGRDTLYNIEAIDASDYNDFIVGSDTNNDKLSGNKGNDTIYGGGGNDTLLGGEGSDTLKGEDGNDVLYELSTIQSQGAPVENSYLYGGTGSDIFSVGIKGSSNTEIIFDSGNLSTVLNNLVNVIYDRDPSAQRLITDIGVDMFANLLSGIPIIGGHLSRLTQYGNAARNAQLDLEEIQRKAQEAKDIVNTLQEPWLSVDFKQRNVVVIEDFQIGIDKIILPNDVPASNVSYSLKAAEFNGSFGVGIYFNNGISDELFVFVKNNYNNIDDTKLAELLEDVLKGGVIASSRRTKITGGNFPDTIVDMIHGVSYANDTIEGLAGNDILAGLFGDDIIEGGDGDDRLYGGFNGPAPNFSNNPSLVYTDDGIDIIFGGQGNDEIHGETGNDWLSGGSGADTLTGGSGADTFVFNSATEGLDTITDFSTAELDKIEISKIGFGNITDTSNFSFDSMTGALSFGTQQIAILDNVTSFNTATDIVLV